MRPAALTLTAAAVMAALSGCSSWVCTNTTAERGEAAVEVRIVNASGQFLDSTAEVTDWRLEPHPQAPSQGDQVHFEYRFEGAVELSNPSVDACAVDDSRVALGCVTVHSSQAFGPDGPLTGDAWLTLEHPERATEVLLLPNDQSYPGRTCEQDPKDGGGPHPPEPAGRGDQL
ncbi:hypothetical protein AB0D49_34495 [Streptomyces sp. NPDC048290]|uniref:hypothetical protein n=1 Tax=Streptomyces sp. NPDC048290 TaxID=3155811 RepID=UPI00341D28FA